MDRHFLQKVLWAFIPLGILTPLIALMLTFGLARTYTGLLERLDGIALATLILAFTSGLPHAVNAFLARWIKDAKEIKALCLISAVVFVLQVLALYDENDAMSFFATAIYVPLLLTLVVVIGYFIAKNGYKVEPPG